jgi:hypothetical protein
MIRDGKVVKTVMRSFSLQEISAVDRPAQQGARATIMKRDETPLEKANYDMALTTMTGGHSHLVVLGGADYMRRAGDTSFSDGHCHPWLMTEAGDVVVGHAMGHNHGIEVISKHIQRQDADATNLLPDSGKPADLLGKNDSAGTDQTAETTAAREDQSMTQQSNQAADVTAVEKKYQEQVTSLTKRAERAEAVASMTETHRAFLKSLSGADADAFVAASETDRETLVAKAADANQVVYTSMDGTSYRKNDDARLVKMAQEMDSEKKKRMKMEQEAYKADLEKRAAELAHIPGDLNARVALLKGIDSLSPEERTSAVAALKAQNDRLSKSFQTLGTSSAPSVDENLDPLDALATEIAKRDAISFEKAYAKALNTAEGQKLYNRHVEKRMGVSV